MAPKHRRFYAASAEWTVKKMFFTLRAVGLEAEAGKKQVNLSFKPRPVVAKQCRAKQSLQIGGDDLGHVLGVKFGWQFTRVFGGFQAVRKRADKGRHIRLDGLL